MGLDYTAGCVNFRDVGEWLNLLAEQPVFEHGRLLRGGKLNHVTCAAAIKQPATVINLRRGPDHPEWLFEAEMIHLPANDRVENYDTRHPRVRRWLRQVVRVAADPGTHVPLLVHCTSGKDRTGVAVATLLFAAGVDPALITEEYLLSDGVVRREWIEQAIDGFVQVDGYFDTDTCSALKQRFCLGSIKG